MLPLILAMSTAQADIPMGTPIDDAVAIDLTSKGLDSLTEVATTLIPSRIDVGDFSDFGEECFIFCVTLWEYDIRNVWVSVDFDQLALNPGPNNTLVLDGIISVVVNEPADPIGINVEAIGISDTCEAYVNEFQVSVSATVQADLVTLPATGEKVIDFTIGPPAWSWTLDDSDIQLTGPSCDLDGIADVAGFLGFDLFQELIDRVEPEIDALVMDLPAQLEPVLDNALPSLTFVDTFDVLGVPLSFQVEPADLRIDQGGLRISLLSKIEAPVAECVEPFLVDMVDTPSQLPPISNVPGSVPFRPDINAIVDDDFVNQALYAIWAGGVLCVDADTDLGLPIPLSSLVGGLLPEDEFEEVFDLDTLEVAITPTQPPRFESDGPADVNLTLDGMGIGFNAQLEGRKVRVANVNLSMDLGTDLQFDGQTGELAVAIDLLGADIGSEVDFNEYLPDTTAAIEDKVPTTIQTLFPFVTPLLEDLVFAIPSFEGAGVRQVSVDPAGPDKDRLGLYAAIGPVPYQSKGCEDGCAGTGCNTGPSGLALLAFPVVVVGLRRRRTA